MAPLYGLIPSVPLALTLLLLPNSLQRFAKLALAEGSCQFPFPEDAADPPDLQTTADQGNQTQMIASILLP